MIRFRWNWNWRRIGKWKSVRKILFMAMGAMLGLVLITNLWVVISTASRIVDSPKELSGKRTALVLGTSNKLSSGARNPYFADRIAAARELFESGKVSHFILSGDNRSVYYNEPVEMKKALVLAGVPDSLITLDYAGLRTLDSIVRSKEIFGQDSILVVTQTFHGYRAIFISQFYDVDALVVKPPKSQRVSARIMGREIIARSLAVVDLYLLRTGPRFLGKKIELPKENLR